MPQIVAKPGTLVGRYSEFKFSKNYGSVFEAIFGRKVEWLENYEDALKLAFSKSATILTLFTGSDWCPYCKALHNEVLTSLAFRKWFNSHNLVAMLVDFPHDAPQSQATMTQNAELQLQYDISGFPTVLALRVAGVCLPNGTCVYNATEKGRLVGFTPGTDPSVWISQFEAIPGPP